VVWPQNHLDYFSWFDLKTSGNSFLQFGLKTGGDGFSRFGLKNDGAFLGCASKPRWWRVSQFGPQNLRLRFGDLGLKITTMVSWFEPQNQADFGLLIEPQNQQREVSMGHASRSIGLLHVEASWARIS
jgi:hypothetical protein